MLSRFIVTDSFLVMQGPVSTTLAPHKFNIFETVEYNVARKYS